MVLFIFGLIECIFAYVDKPTIVSLPLFGGIGGEAYYYANIFIGTPPQRQSVILDTASSILAVSCADCKACGTHIDPPFDIKKSKTAVKLRCDDARCYSGLCSSTVDDHGNTFQGCNYYQAYSEGSRISGYYFSDILTLSAYGSRIAPNEIGPWANEMSLVDKIATRYDHIGCGQEETRLFLNQQANGIIGIAFPKNDRQPTAVDSLFGASSFAQNVDKRIFSVCLAEEGGVFSVGGYDRRYVTGTIDTSMTTSIVGKNAYAIGADSLIIKNMGEKESRNEVEYNLSFGKTIVDSGTTFSYFPHKVFDILVDSIDAACNQQNGCKTKGLQRCTTVQSFDRSKILDELESVFPTFIIKTRDGADIDVSPRSYFYEKVPGFWCAGIENNRTTESVLGMTFMKNKMIVVNRDLRKLSILSAICPNTSEKDRSTNVIPSSMQQWDEEVDGYSFNNALVTKTRGFVPALTQNIVFVLLPLSVVSLSVILYLLLGQHAMRPRQHEPDETLLQVEMAAT